MRLAVANIETRKLTETVIESWKPVLANAIGEWAKQRTLTSVLERPVRSDSQAVPDAGGASRIETTPEELAAFETIQRMLGPTRPLAYEDTASYFKIHLTERYTWVMCRLYFGRKRLTVWVPLALDQAQPLATGFVMSTPQMGWTCIALSATTDIEQLGDVVRPAWDSQRAIHSKGYEHGEPEIIESEDIEIGSRDT